MAKKPNHPGFKKPGLSASKKRMQLPKAKAQKKEEPSKKSGPIQKRPLKPPENPSPGKQILNKKKGSRIRIPKDQLRLIRDLRPSDDVLFSILARDPKTAENMLRIWTENPNLKLASVETQRTVARIGRGKKVIFDALMKDTEGNLYVIEVQQDPRGALPKRPRYLSSTLDVDTLNLGDAYEKLKDSNVIFFTRDDVRGEGRKIYKYCMMDEKTHRPLQDGRKIVYVNGSIHDHSPIGDLSHDMMTRNPRKMRLPWMADIVRSIKQTEEGVNELLTASEKIQRHGERLATRRVKHSSARNLLMNTDLSVEQIAKYIEMPVKTVENLRKSLQDTRNKSEKQKK